MDNEQINKSNRKKKRIRNIAIGVAILLVTNVSAFCFGTVAAVSIPGMGVNSFKISKSLEGVNDVSKFKKMFEVRDLIYKLYDGEIDEDKLVEGAVKGMTNSLNDPYTVFMNQKEFSDFNERNEGSYVGVGLQVGVKGNDIVIIAVFEGSPAAKAGVLPGDVLKKVNDVEVTGKESDKAVSMMKNGKVKEKITLTLEREEKGSFTTDVYRDTISMVTVKGEMLQNNVGYIQLSMFDEHTGDAFNAKLKELQSAGMKGLILDIRENPGGLLNESIKVLSNFVEEGKVITSTIDKYKAEKKYTSKGGSAIGMPLVLLINENSASASEIVAGVIRDYKIGTLVGNNTFGKGIVQTVLNLNDGTGFKVTISKYYTPNGENIHKKGIAPDVEVKMPNELRGKDFDKKNDPQFKKALEIINEKIK
ncbi:S41 family peptidase [Clostridium hydrogeniformans]|uniref:S41 family peptidase n=1 Tax=Clostridium hydrogeniformans TaxID=349933 RepID=UPI0005551705|nr:S41 family peptidase [Clostridium hydrogeniformans]